MSGARVLIIDDETQLRRTLNRTLDGHGYATREAEDGESGLREFHSFKPDVVLLDLVLPDIDGVTVCRRMRETSQTPVIVLSAVGDERRKVEALDAGADDYLTKPFGSDELLARIRVALRRGSSERPQASLIRVDGLRIDLERRRVTLAGADVHLTPTEYSLLKYLAINAGKVLTHPMLLRAVWGPEYSGDVQLLRTYVNQLRSKLEDDSSSPRFIRTDPGVGYRFADPDRES
jgi:two-component system, OmpR family, KDP operon response regulator KdpE